MSRSLPFPVGCSSIAFRSLPAGEAIRRIADAGFPAVELWFPHVEEMDRAGLEALRARCRGLGLEIPVVSPYFSFTRGRARWLESLETGRRAVKAAAALGARKIRTFVDAGPDGLPSARAGEDDWQAAVAGLRALCALDPSREFVVETHDRTLADTLPSVTRLLDAVDRPNLRLNFQANADFLERGLPECLERLLPAVSHLHWQQRDEAGGETYLEEPGRIDFARLAALLARRGYAGTASVEYCWPEVEEGRIASAARFLQDIGKAVPAMEAF